MCDHCGCRSFGAIAELTDEHETILHLAWQLAEAHRTGTPGAAALPAPLLALLDVHVLKEEIGLYPMLLDQGDLAVEVAQALEEEHADLRSVLTGGGFDRRTYYELAAHIEQEETELFPAAMFAFDDDGWEDLERAHLAAAAASSEPLR